RRARSRADGSAETAGLETRRRDSRRGRRAWRGARGLTVRNDVETEGVTEGRVYGRNPVLELLRRRGRQADEIAVLSGGRGPLAEVVALARQAGVKVS